MSGNKQDRRRICLYAWDGSSQSWSGPDELGCALKGNRRILGRLREAGASWQGELRIHTAGFPAVTFRVQLRDLGDACLAALDMEGGGGGPSHAILVIPEARRGRLRPEMAFEFTAFLRFLSGPPGHGSDLAFHDGLERALREAEPGATIVISAETGVTSADERLLTAEACERLTMSMVAWAAGRDAKPAAG